MTEQAAKLELVVNQSVPTVEPPTKEAEREPQAKWKSLLLAIGKPLEKWHDESGVGYATIRVKGHDEHLPIRSEQFSSYLRQICFRKYQDTPSRYALEDAIALMEAQALFDGATHPVFVRVGSKDGKIYVDLCDEKWRVVEIGAKGWKALDVSPVRFLRRQGMQRLPEPLRNGTPLTELRQCLNVGNEDDWRMLAAWLVGILKPDGPYPVLILGGEQGSAKSTTMKLLRHMIDPHTTLIRRPPGGERDLPSAVANNYVLAYDNLSRITQKVSDALCTIATGGGFAARKLYTDGDEFSVKAARPIILNGIPDLASRPDLADRAIVIELPMIAGEKRRTEAEIWSTFDGLHPELLGSLFDAVSCALRRQSEVELKHTPRMADFAHFVTAAEPGLGWSEGTFLAAYKRKSDEARLGILDHDPVAIRILEMLGSKLDGVFQGTMTQLLAELNQGAYLYNRSYGWPRSPQYLASTLRRIEPALRSIGVIVTRHREGKTGKRIVTIR